MNKNETIQSNKDEYIKPFFPNDTVVVKKTDATGNVNYCKRNSQDTIRAMDEELDTALMCLLEPIQIIEMALCNSDNIPFANSLTIARQNILNTICEMFGFIGQKIGVINITRIYELEINSMYRWGQCVDAKLLPPDVDEKRSRGKS